MSSTARESKVLKWYVRVVTKSLLTCLNFKNKKDMLDTFNMQDYVLSANQAPNSQWTMIFPIRKLSTNKSLSKLMHLLRVGYSHYSTSTTIQPLMRNRWFLPLKFVTLSITGHRQCLFYYLKQGIFKRNKIKQSNPT